MFYGISWLGFNRSKKNCYWLGVVLLMILIASMGVTVSFAQQTTSAVVQKTELDATRIIIWAFIAAAIVTGLSCIGAGIAVAYVASAAMGVVGERPELMGRALIFVGLAEGIAIYGLLIAILILMRIGQILPSV